MALLLRSGTALRGRGLLRPGAGHVYARSSWQDDAIGNVHEPFPCQIRGGLAGVLEGDAPVAVANETALHHNLPQAHPDEDGAAPAPVASCNGSSANRVGGFSNVAIAAIGPGYHAATMNVELRCLKSLLAVAEEMHGSRAARGDATNEA